MFETGLKNDPCMREWLEDKEKRGSRRGQKRGDVRRDKKDKAKQMSGCGNSNVSKWPHKCRVLHNQQVCSSGGH